jgi:hypothetical protein
MLDQEVFDGLPVHVDWDQAKPSLQLRRGRDGQLWARNDGRSQPVKVTRCFPWSDPNRFVSLRTVDDDEFALVVDPGDLDGASREALDAGLAEAGFVMEIVRILALEEEVEIHLWDVETRQGHRRFQTRRDDWPRQMPGGGLLIRDVAGDLFFVSDPAALDPKSADLLWIFVD